MERIKLMDLSVDTKNHELAITKFEPMPKKSNRIPSGIPGLDDLIEGDFVPGSVILDKTLEKVYSMGVPNYKWVPLRYKTHLFCK